MKQALEYCCSPGRDANPSQGYPQVVCRRYPYIHLGEQRQGGVKFLVPKKNAEGKAWTPDLLIVACENIRFSSLFVKTSPASKSEEKRMFSQAIQIGVRGINRSTTNACS